jgi:plastocyanin
VRTRTKAVVLATGAALALPSAAQAATKVVFMGLPPVSASKSIQQAGADVNDFFPHGITVRQGDSIKFAPVGFHTVDLAPKGGIPLALFGPTGAKVSGEKDAAGTPFWFNDQVDQIAFNPAVLPQGYGKKFSFNGTKRVDSGFPLAEKLKPMTVKFKAKGTFTYYCDIHPGMKGKVTVKGRKAKVPSQKADAKVIATQIKAASKIAKALPKKTVPANTVDVGVAGPKGVEYYGFLPGSVTVPVGTTLNFRMTKGSFEDHTATTGPGDPENDPASYLGTVAATFQGPGPFLGQAVYPSEPAGAAASITPTFHGNGFWNSGVLDNSTASPLPASGSVKFGAPGAYQFYCLIHPFMHGTVNVQ